jgi:hypothetical protein
MKKTLFAAALSALSLTVFTAAPAASSTPATPAPAGKPASAEDVIAKAAKTQFAHMDANQDGKVSKAEFLAPAEAMFAKLDKNHDGVATLDEVEAAMRAIAAEQEQMMEKRRAEVLKAMKDVAAKPKPAAPSVTGAPGSTRP